MSSIKDDVHDAIDQDIFLQEGFERDILNKSAVARWLIKHRDIEGGFETVYDVVERYEPDGSSGGSRPWTATQDMRIDQTTGVHALLLEQGQDSIESLRDLFDQDDGNEVDYRVVPSRGRVLVSVKDSDREAAIQAIGPANIAKQVPNLLEISIEPRLDEQPGALPLSLLVLALVNRGIEVPYVASGHREQFVLISQEDEGEAMDVVTELIVDPEL